MSTVRVAHQGRLIVLESRGSQRWHVRLVMPPLGAIPGDGGREVAGPFESLDAAWSTARRYVDETCDQDKAEAARHGASPSTPTAGDAREMGLAREDPDLADVRPEDRRRMARYLAHRLANVVQLLGGRLYMEGEKGLGGCPIYRAAQDMVARMEGLLSAVRALGALEVPQSATEHRMAPAPADVRPGADAV